MTFPNAFQALLDETPKHSRPAVLVAAAILSAVAQARRDMLSEEQVRELLIDGLVAYRSNCLAEAATIILSSSEPNHTGLRSFKTYALERSMKHTLKFQTLCDVLLPPKPKKESSQ